MKIKLIHTTSLFLWCCTICSQKIVYYKHGKEGIEQVYTKKDSTIIFCNSKARPNIKDEVIALLVKRYEAKQLKEGFVVLELENAKVYGVIHIQKGEGRLKTITITYQKIEYQNGIIEIQEN